MFQSVRLMGGLLLKVDHQNEINFIYQVVATETRAPSFMLDDESSLSLKYYKAEVFLKKGEKLDVMEWTQEDLLQDIIDQYERHLYFLNVVRN